MEKYSETSPYIVDRDVGRYEMRMSNFGGMWDHDKETRQSDSNAAVERTET